MMHPNGRRLRVAIVADYPEEGWPSMDLVAEMLVAHLGPSAVDGIDAVRVCPPFRRRSRPLPIPKATRHNVDRLLNRFVDYPKFLRDLDRRGRFDIYHVVDQSYAQLVHALPAGRTVVNCHDLDAFRCLLRPDLEPRPAWFRALMRRVLAGLGRAGAVSCGSRTTEADVLEHRLAPADRVRMIYTGIHPEYLDPPRPSSEAEADRLVGPADPHGAPILLHVGSNIPRKRIDVLLATFAGVRRAIPGARLVKIGGEFAGDQLAMARDLGIVGAIRSVPFVADRSILAAIYRRASLVLQPSDAEGFGLPLAEAMACGAPLLVSDIPVLREIAGDAADYRPVGDLPGWVAAALALLREPIDSPGAHSARREAGRARSARYRWDSHVERLVPIYRGLADAAGPC